MDLTDSGSAAPAGWHMARRMPAPALRRTLTRRYVGFTETAPMDGPWTAFPTGTTTMVLNVADCRATLPDGFVAGLTERCVRVERVEGMACVDLKLTPVGAYTIVGRPLDELTGQVVDVDGLFGAAGRRLLESLRETPSWDARFDRVERFLLERLATGPRPAPAVTWAWRQVVRTHGAVSISDLADRVGWSRKHLTAVFRRQVGLPPKTVARIARFDHLMRRLRSEQRPGWGRLALDCGFYDQAHLCRDVRELAGMTPTELAAQAGAAEVPFIQDSAGSGR